MGVTLLKNAHVAQPAVGNGMRGSHSNGAGRDWEKSAPFECYYPIKAREMRSRELFQATSLALLHSPASNTYDRQQRQEDLLKHLLTLIPQRYLKFPFIRDSW